jgi:hypothetical protein
MPTLPAVVGVHPHTLIPFAESGVSHRDVPRSAPGEAADVVGRAGHKSVPRPGSDADLLGLGSSPIDAAPRSPTSVR